MFNRTYISFYRTITLITLLLILENVRLAKSELDYKTTCSNLCNLKTQDCTYKYENIPINLKIICLLKSYINLDSIEPEDIRHLDYIRYTYNGTCQNPGGISSNILVYDRLDSRVDFPIGYDTFSDSLRGKIISCLDDFNIRKQVTALENFRLDILRNTLDYYAGLTNGDLRSASVIKSDITSVINSEYVASNHRVEYYPSRGSYRKFENSDRILQARNLFFDPAPALILAIEVFMKSKTVANFVKSASQAAKMIKVASEMAGTVNTFMALGRNMAGLMKQDKEDKDLMMKQTQEIILNGQKAALEYRKQDLELQQGILLSNQLSNMLLTAINVELEGVNEKLNEISDQLDKVNEELEGITGKLDELNKKVDDLDFDVEVHVEIPNLPGNNYGGKSESETALSLDIGEYISEYENLGCEDFVTQKHLIQETCFMYFFLSQQNNKISNADYLRYRYDSLEILTLDNLRETCLMIGGNHPKFTSKFLQMNITFHGDMTDMDENQSIEFIETSPRMYLFLFIDIVRSYSIDWFMKVFNVVRKNRGFNYYDDRLDSLQNFTNYIGNEQSICL